MEASCATELGPVPEPAATQHEVVARWGGIVAGVVFLLALLALFGEIGMAAGLSAFDAGDRAAPYAIGAGVWGFVTAIAAFLGGGYLASRVSRHLHARAGATQGLLVWALAVPVIGVLAAVLAIGATTAAGVATVAAVQADPAGTAQARETIRAEAERNGGGRTETLTSAPTTGAALERASKAAGAAGWAMVGAMLLSLAAAAAGGVLGTRGTGGGVVVERPAYVATRGAPIPG
jgi:hypothetical protein